MNRTTRLAVVLATMLALLATATSALADPNRGPARSDTVEVKFREGTEIRMRGGELVTLARADLSDVRAVLRRFPGSRLRPLFQRPEADLARELEQLEAESGRELADLNLYFSIVTNGREDAAALAVALAELPIVEDAYMAPEAAPLPATADLTPQQGYRGAAPDGIDVSAAALYAGGRGDRVKVVDIEYSWNVNHEDLSKARLPGAFIPSSPNPANWGTGNDHGTAVLGELTGDANGIGVTGLVPNAAIGMVNANDANLGYVLANAVDVARANMSRGDVMLIEQQTNGWDCPVGTCYVPVEWIPSVYDAIVRATAAGIIVVEAAGNGNQNLDDPWYGSRFPRGKADSGAIIVGAGGSPGCGIYPQPTRSRLSYSTYGSRVDVQAWGECVATTGYGNYLNPGDANGWYTLTFSGTSSASPIVAAAAASVSSAVETATGRNLTSVEVRSILARTGTAQDFTTAGALGGKVGPLPNLALALKDQLGSISTDTTPPAMGAVVEQLDGQLTGTTVPVKISWSATDPGGVTAYEVYRSVNGGAYALQTTVPTTATSYRFGLAFGQTNRFAVRARDAAGNWSGYQYSPTLKPGAADDLAFALSSPWSRYSWADAYGSTGATAAQKGAWIQYSFNGRDVALVSPRFATGGRATLYCDGTSYGLVDLYAATTVARQVVAWCRFPQVGNHTMKIVLEGTVGRPRFDVDAFATLS